MAVPMQLPTAYNKTSDTESKNLKPATDSIPGKFDKWRENCEKIKCQLWTGIRFSASVIVCFIGPLIIPSESLSRVIVMRPSLPCSDWETLSALQRDENGKTCRVYPLGRCNDKASTCDWRGKRYYYYYYDLIFLGISFGFTTTIKNIIVSLDVAYAYIIKTPSNANGGRKTGKRGEVKVDKQQRFGRGERHWVDW